MRCALVGQDGLSPLAHAVLQGREDMVERLVSDPRVDINLSTKRGTRREQHNPSFPKPHLPMRLPPVFQPVQDGYSFAGEIGSVAVAYVLPTC